MTYSFHQVCILLGSNIFPERNLPKAMVALGQQLLVTRISSVWQTKAVGSTGSDFLNAAVLGYTRRHPARLKTEVLRPLEANMGRVRTSDKNASRTIDLDIVVFDQHPVDRNLWDYAHAAVPVAELLPEIPDPLTGVHLRQAAQLLAARTSVVKREDLNIPAFISPALTEPVSWVAPHPGSFFDTSLRIILRGP